MVLITFTSHHVTFDHFTSLHFGIIKIENKQKLFSVIFKEADKWWWWCQWLTILHAVCNGNKYQDAHSKLSGKKWFFFVFVLFFFFFFLNKKVSKYVPERGKERKYFNARMVLLSQQQQQQWNDNKSNKNEAIKCLVFMLHYKCKCCMR